MTTNKQARKERPIAKGVLDYFPDAIAEVANVSYVGNQQHNPGEEMHWAKGKSADHADCVARHLIERGTIDDDGLRHSAKLAWRALALLQIEIEAEAKTPKNGQPAGPFFDRPERERDFRALVQFGCPEQVARQIVGGISYSTARKPDENRAAVYVAGPMRGYPNFNFPRFDQARDELLKNGYDVISPADIDRASGDVNEKDATHKAHQRDFALRDFWALYYMSRIDGDKRNALMLLPHWEKSVGANAELRVAQWLGLKVMEV